QTDRKKNTAAIYRSISIQNCFQQQPDASYAIPDSELHVMKKLLPKIIITLAAKGLIGFFFAQKDRFGVFGQSIGIVCGGAALHTYRMYFGHMFGDSH